MPETIHFLRRVLEQIFVPDVQKSKFHVLHTQSSVEGERNVITIHIKFIVIHILRKTQSKCNKQMLYLSEM